MVYIKLVAEKFLMTLIICFIGSIFASLTYETVFGKILSFDNENTIKILIIVGHITAIQLIAIKLKESE